MPSKPLTGGRAKTNPLRSATTIANVVDAIDAPGQNGLVPARDALATGNTIMGRQGDGIVSYRGNISHISTLDVDVITPGERPLFTLSTAPTTFYQAQSRGVVNAVELRNTQYNDATAFGVCIVELTAMPYTSPYRFGLLSYSGGLLQPNDYGTVEVLAGNFTAYNTERKVIARFGVCGAPMYRGNIIAPGGVVDSSLQVALGVDVDVHNWLGAAGAGADVLLAHDGQNGYKVIAQF